MTIEELNSLERTIGLKTIANEEDFNSAIGLSKVMIYFLVDWSGPERVSRSTVYKTLNIIEHNEVPVFKIDCSEQNQNFVKQWLHKQDGLFEFDGLFSYTLVQPWVRITEDQLRMVRCLYMGGYGEALLIKEGKLTEFMRYPGAMIFDIIRDKLAKWLSKEINYR